MKHPLYKHIDYQHFPYNPDTVRREKSITVIGIDTEADEHGKCFMICTSLGDVWKPEQWPTCVFNRRYRNCTFVAYNLKYDEGHLISFLPRDLLLQLRETGEVKYNGFKIKIIPKKFLRITLGKNSITVYDLYNFYNCSLDSAAKTYLNRGKIELPTKTFDQQYIDDNWGLLADYCIEDARLTEELGNKIIKQFEQWGVKPRALYSTAYVTYQYFRRHTKYVTVERFWDKYPDVLWAAYNSYNGGKFEVTRKGVDYYYEYDIVSAYPYEIGQLIDISYARVIITRDYVNHAVYGFLLCEIKIPPEIHSPLAVKCNGVNTYPVGHLIKYITLQEYDYLLSVGSKIKILHGVWLDVNHDEKPYHDEIHRLMKYKHEYKRSGDKLNYHIIKIFLNSLYGKFVQLIKTSDKPLARSCWNPIYGSIITANTRIKISDAQNIHKSVVAVHTDSIISTKPLDYGKSGVLGDMVYETEGDGVILGSGVYQIGDITKLRGFYSKMSLLDLIEVSTRKIWVQETHAYSWREVLHRGLDTDCINRFETRWKKLHIGFDRKRIWLNDYKSFRELKKRRVYSIPYVSSIPKI